MFAARMALHAKSHRSRYTGFYIAAVLFLLLPHHFFCYCHIIFLLLPHHFFFSKKKIAAPRRTRVTNSTKICRTSLVARYAAPPALRVTRQHILPVRYSSAAVARQELGIYAQPATCSLLTNTIHLDLQCTFQSPLSKRKQRVLTTALRSCQ